MDPATMSAIGGLGSLFGGGGKTSVSQSVTNNSFSTVQATISGISHNPQTGGLTADQSGSATAGALSSGTPQSGGSFLDGLLGGNGGAFDFGAPSPAVVAAPSNAFGGNVALALGLGVAALAGAFWFAFGRKRR